MTLISTASLTSRIPTDIPIYYLDNKKKWFEIFPFTQIKQFLQISKIVKILKPDILHAYFFWPIMYGRIFKLLGRVKTLVENREDEGFNWGCLEYFLLRLTRNIPDRIVCVSESVREIVIRKEIQDPAKISMIHNGVEIPRNKSIGKNLKLVEELGISYEDPIVGMVANFNRKVKGVSYFIESIPLILDAVPNTHFLLVGKGSERDTLEGTASKLNIRDNLHFVGYREDLQSFYSIMDISVLTSLSEGLSITILESMSYGLPVVVTRVGGNPEIVVDGETGFLVPPMEVDIFSDNVVELLRNQEMRKRMGKEGSKRIESYFNLKSASEKYIKIYDRFSQSISKQP